VVDQLLPPSVEMKIPARGELTGAKVARYVFVLSPAIE